MPPAILTIGHSTHELDEFVGLLRRHEVELLVDVRAYPSSRRVPWTNSAELGRSLAAEGVGYEHARALGGRRRTAEGSPNGAWRNEQFRGYADHMDSDEFQEAVERLLAEERRLAVMCAEAQWWRCHRRLLADAFLARAREVLHVDSRGGAEPHTLTEFALVEGGRVMYPPPQGTLEV